MKGLITTVMLMIAPSVVTTGCAPHQQYNTAADQYLEELSSESSVGTFRAEGDLAIVEFDEYGGFWDLDQLEAAVELVRTRSAEAENGVLLWLYVHGWMNDANQDQSENDLARFRSGVLARMEQAATLDGHQPEHIVGVYVGWRGASTRAPLFWQLSFWERRRAAERIASFNMIETITRLSLAARENPGSKVLVMGHSLGGLAVSKTVLPAMATKATAAVEVDTPLVIDQVMLLNPAVEAVYTAQVIDFLKRSSVRLEIRSEDGTRRPATGPWAVSITSEADWVTSKAYRAGLVADRWDLPTRRDHAAGEPSQWQLATTAEGHAEYLASHRAWVEDGEVRLERIDGAYNDTPYWVIRTTSEICADHGDLANPYFRELRRQIFALDGDYGTRTRRWLTAGSLDGRATEALHEVGEREN